jgi:hypothetical protein
MESINGELVDNVLCLTTTRLNLSCAINYIPWFMQPPKIEH